MLQPNGGASSLRQRNCNRNLTRRPLERTTPSGRRAREASTAGRSVYGGNRVSKKPSRRPRAMCLIDGCRSPAKVGSKVCTEHLHPLRLQEEIERLRSTRGGEWKALLERFPDLRELAEHLTVLAFRAEPGRGSALAVVPHARGHAQNDGVVAIGDTRVVHRDGVSVSKDQGRLGAGVAAVAQARRQLERLVSGVGEGTDPRPRCGRRACKGKNVRQPMGAQMCCFCGEPIGGAKPGGNVEPAGVASENGAAAITGSDERPEVRLTDLDRRVMANGSRNPDKLWNSLGLRR